MPDHMHGILIITHLPDANGDVQRYGLPQVMQALKSMSARRINIMRKTPGTHVWQEGYYDRIIRNETEMGKYRGYILTNPLRTTLKR